MSAAENNPFRKPTDAEIDAAQQRLGVVFHRDYRAFLLGGSDVGDSVLEPAVVLPGSGHRDLFEIVTDAWKFVDLPRDLLPFVEDNGDYYCLTKSGEVVFWTHNGETEERWRNIEEWRQQVCISEG
jgi:hypothetical protein